MILFIAKPPVQSYSFKQSLKLMKLFTFRLIPALAVVSSNRKAFLLSGFEMENLRCRCRLQEAR